MLEVRQLEKVVENRSVLSIDQLEMNSGEVVALIGPAHSGKSTLIRLLSGAMLPSGGTIILDGESVTISHTARKRIGTLFEEDLLYERHSAQRNLDFYCRLHNLPKSRSGEMLKQVGLSDQAQKPVSKLAANAQRRLAFIRVVMGQHALLLLDQPILRTDLDTQALFARLISSAAAEGATILVADEDLSWASKCCTRVIELEDGRITNRYALETGTAGTLAPERLIPFKVPARKDDRIMLFDPGDILYATSRDGKTYLRTPTEEATTNLTLQELESRLNGRGFFKAHRAYLVNLQHIKAVIQFTRNSYSLQLSDKQETIIPLSKQSEKELQDLLGY
ncbi:MAG: ATP-binding cassette domain-containing protein [Ktedonobacteraceae bacterium]|nr:ATP-binding cassette domain-containing protein [Ktedonobacteraceae bacterium]